MTKGHLFFAQNTDKIDYLTQAYTAALTVKIFNKENSTCLVTNDPVPVDYLRAFDHIIPIPWGDDARDSSWKIENRWKLIHCSPFEHTLVYDSDVLLLSSNDYWWKYLEDRHIMLTTVVKDFRSNKIIDKINRLNFICNSLPNVYFGVHYFKKTKQSYEFYKWLEVITKNWQIYYEKYSPLYTQKFPSMDVSSAIACKILNLDLNATPLSFTHMKSVLQSWKSLPEHWYDACVVEFNDDVELKISNYLQTGVFHYVDETFLTNDIIEKIENKYAKLVHLF